MNRSKSKTAPRRRNLFSVFVGRLHNDVTEKDVRELFSGCGVVKDLFIANNVAGENNYGFIRYGKADEAVRAIKELNGWPLKNQSIIVDVSHESADKLHKGLEDKVSLVNIDVDQTESAVLDTEIPMGCISKIINFSRVKETYLFTNVELASAQPKGILHLDELERQIDKTEGAALHLPYFQTEYKDLVTSPKEIASELQRGDTLNENPLLTSRQFMTKLEEIQDNVKELKKKNSTSSVQKQSFCMGNGIIKKENNNSEGKNQAQTELSSLEQPKDVNSDKKEHQPVEKAADMKLVQETKTSRDKMKQPMHSNKSSPNKATYSKPLPHTKEFCTSKKKLFKSASSMYVKNEQSQKDKTSISSSENSLLMPGTLLELGKNARAKVQTEAEFDHGDFRDCSACLISSPQKLSEPDKEGGRKSEKEEVSWSLREKVELATQEDRWDMKKGSSVFDPKDFASKLFCQFIPSPSKQSPNSDFRVSVGNDCDEGGNLCSNASRIIENKNMEQKLISDLNSFTADLELEENIVSPVLSSRLAYITGRNKGLPSLGRGFPLCGVSPSASFSSGGSHSSSSSFSQGVSD